MSEPTYFRGIQTPNQLWNIPLQPCKLLVNITPKILLPKPLISPVHLHAANGKIRKDRIKSELAAHYTASSFNMRQSTLTQAIHQNHLFSW